LQFDDAVIIAAEIRSKSLENIAEILFQRLVEIREQVEPLSNPAWKMTFLQQCEELENSKYWYGTRGGLSYAMGKGYSAIFFVNQNLRRPC